MESRNPLKKASPDRGNGLNRTGVPRFLDAGLGKLPPQAPDLEEAVLGALMIEKDALTSVVDILKPLPRAICLGMRKSTSAEQFGQISQTFVCELCQLTVVHHTQTSWTLNSGCTLFGAWEYGGF